MKAPIYASTAGCLLTIRVWEGYLSCPAALLVHTGQTQMDWLLRGKSSCPETIEDGSNIAISLEKPRGHKRVGVPLCSKICFAYRYFTCLTFTVLNKNLGGTPL
uniref:Uncharacterized protein n=1 Tax=Echeneis naucrates TaxID=173247 RepID=A0A665UWU4_ECHNA